MADFSVTQVNSNILLKKVNISKHVRCLLLVFFLNFYEKWSLIRKFQLLTIPYCRNWFCRRAIPHLNVLGWVGTNPRAEMLRRGSNIASLWSYSTAASYGICNSSLLLISSYTEFRLIQTKSNTLQNWLINNFYLRSAEKLMEAPIQLN